MIEENKLHDEETISMLLDTEHLYGEHEGRLGPILGTLCISAIPVLLYVYFGLFEYIPVWLFAPAAVFIAIRAIMIIPGREGYRLTNYKRRLYDDYTAAADLMRVKKIYPDGLVEYVNGKCCYFVKAYNGTCENELLRTQMLRKFLLSMLGDFEFDTYILNDSYTGSVRQYYSKVNRFGKNTASMNFTKIIDKMSFLTKNKSMVQCTVFAIKGTRSDWKQMKLQINGAIGSKMSKAFKRVYLVSSVQEVQELIDLDMDTNVCMDDLLRAKYRSGEYYNSRVIAYDPKDEIVIGEKEVLPDEEAKPTERVKTTSTFHVAFVEEESSTSVLNRATPKPDYYKQVVVGGKSIEEEIRSSTHFESEQEEGRLRERERPEKHKERKQRGLPSKRRIR